MKYAIWRHENSLGNSAEQVIGLYKELIRNQDNNINIYVEHDFQRCFALCIPLIEEKNIHYINPEKSNKFDFLGDVSIKENIRVQNAYKEGLLAYPGSWADLSREPDCTLQFPNYLYTPKNKYTQKIIVLQLREKNTFYHREVGSCEEPERFINPETFFEIAEYYANKDYLVVRLGDKNQTPMPYHKNIIDFALQDKESILDDLSFINNSSVFISCDTGIWPMAGGMKKNLVLCNVTSVFAPLEAQIVSKQKKFYLMYKIRKFAVVDWLPKNTSVVLFKKPDVHTLEPKDNTATEIISAAQRFVL